MQDLERIEYYIEVVCRTYKVKRVDLVSKSRIRELVTPRHMVWYLIRTYTNITLRQICSVFNKDHASVIHGVRMIETLKVYDDINQNLNKILETIRKEEICIITPTT